MSIRKAQRLVAQLLKRAKKPLSIKFDLVMTVEDYNQLLTLAEGYSLSMAAVVRLAIHDLYHKKEAHEGVKKSDESHPILNTTHDAIPAEVDPFWKNFRA